MNFDQRKAGRPASRIGGRTGPSQRGCNCHLVHAPRSGGKASDARNPDRYATREIRSARGLSRAFLAKRKCHRYRCHHRRACWQVCRTDPRHPAVGTRVSALINVTDPFSKPFLENIQLGGEVTGTTINPIRSAKESRPLSPRSRRAPMPSSPSLPQTRHRCPKVSCAAFSAAFAKGYVNSPRFPELFRPAAYVDKILRAPSRRPAVVQPTNSNSSSTSRPRSRSAYYSRIILAARR